MLPWGPGGQRASLWRSLPTQSCLPLYILKARDEATRTSAWRQHRPKLSCPLSRGRGRSVRSGRSGQRYRQKKSDALDAKMTPGPNVRNDSDLAKVNKETGIDKSSISNYHHLLPVTSFHICWKWSSSRREISSPGASPYFDSPLRNIRYMTS